MFEKASYIASYHNLLNYTERENLLNINQSGFRASNSWINQLISITHEKYNSSLNCKKDIAHRSILTHRSKLEVYSCIYPKPLIRFGTRDFYSNLNLSESVESCSIFSKTIVLIGFK